MSVYELSFKIKDIPIEGKSATRRRGELYAMIDAMVIPNGDSSLIWKDTTSLAVFRSGRGIGEIAEKLKSVISQHHDLFLIKEFDTKSAIICGDVENSCIFDMFVGDDKRTYLTDITDSSAMSTARKTSANLRYLKGA